MTIVYRLRKYDNGNPSKSRVRPQATDREMSRDERASLTPRGPEEALRAVLATPSARNRR